MRHLLEDQAAIVRARLTIVTAGRCPRILDLDPADVEAAWRRERPIEIRLPETAATARFRVLRPDGTAAVGALVTVATAGSDYSSAYVRATRMTCDEEGVAVHADLDPAGDLVAVALEPDTGRSGRASAIVLGGETTIRLAEATQATVSLRFAGSKRPGWRASASIRTDPIGVLPSLSAQSDRDGVLRLPRCVLSSYRLWITAIDDELNRELGRGPVTTHELRVDGSGIRDGMTLVLPRKR